jgi:NADH dehydrogenase/NADH:ubiquinone oxidoreductase subunit G
LELLGLRKDPAAELAKGGSLLVVVEDDPLALKPEWKAHFDKFQHVLYLGTQECESSRSAHLALPVAPHSECEGTFVNFSGRVQRFKKAMTPEGDAMWGPAVFDLLAGKDGFGWKNAAELWKDLAASESEFEGIDYSALGDGGTTVRSRASEPAAVNG